MVGDGARGTSPQFERTNATHYLTLLVLHLTQAAVGAGIAACERHSSSDSTYRAGVAEAEWAGWCTIIFGKDGVGGDYVFPVKKRQVSHGGDIRLWRLDPATSPWWQLINRPGVDDVGTLTAWCACRRVAPKVQARLLRVVFCVALCTGAASSSQPSPRSRLTVMW